MLETRQLHAFTVLARTLHFGRAADELNMAQSALSAILGRIEDQVEARLVERGRRAPVRLTRAGQTFLAEAERTIAQLARAERIGRAAGRGEAGSLKLGYVFSAAICGRLTEAFRSLRRDLPLLDVAASQFDTPEQVQAVADGRLDAGLCRRASAYPQELEECVVHRETLLLAMGDGHPLSRQETIVAADLADELFVVPQLHGSAIFAKAMAGLARCGRFAMPPLMPADDFVTAASLAASGAAVMLAPRSLTNLRLPKMEFRPIADFRYNVELALLYRRCDRESPAIRSLRTLAIDPSPTPTD